MHSLTSLLIPASNSTVMFQYRALLPLVLCPLETSGSVRFQVAFFFRRFPEHSLKYSQALEAGGTVLPAPACWCG